MIATPTRIDRYVLEGRIAQGALGPVYLAFDPRFERRVALKLLRVNEIGPARERLLHNVRVLDGVKHPGILPTLDVGEHEGQLFVVKPFVEGETLAALIARRPSLDVSRKLELGEELCAGLASAHRHAVIHRCLEPGNLMVDRAGRMHILHVGEAHVIVEAGHEMILGGLHYLSPEEIRGALIDHRSNIYTVGIILFELLSYQSAYRTGHPAELVRQKILADVAPLSQVMAIDPEVDGIVQRATRKAPDERYQDMEALRADLERVRRRLEDEGKTST